MNDSNKSRAVVSEVPKTPTSKRKRYIKPSITRILITLRDTAGGHIVAGHEQVWQANVAGSLS